MMLGWLPIYFVITGKHCSWHLYPGHLLWQTILEKISNIVEMLNFTSAPKPSSIEVHAVSVLDSPAFMICLHCFCLQAALCSSIINSCCGVGHS